MLSVIAVITLTFVSYLYATINKPHIDYFFQRSAGGI